MPRREQNNEQSSCEWLLRDFDFPKLRQGQHKILYVAQMSPQTEALKAKGYDVVDVRLLPRGKELDDQRAVLAWLQGMTEGTIAPDEERRKTLELEGKAAGLFVSRSMRLEGKVDLTADTVDELLGFGPSRYTLGQMTEKKIEEAKRAALVPGKKKVH